MLVVCVLSTLNKSFVVVTSNTAEKFFTPFDGDIYIKGWKFRISVLKHFRVIFNTALYYVQNVLSSLFFL